MRFEYLNNQPETSDTPEELKARKIIELIKSQDMSSDDVSLAYQLAVGFSPEETGADDKVSQEVSSLAKMMEGATNEGLPINALAEIANEMARYELTTETYFGVVEQMNVTDREKRALRSIVNNKRPGRLVIMDPKTHKELGGIEITKNVLDDGVTKSDLALRLTPILYRLINRDVEILFVE